MPIEIRDFVNASDIDQTKIQILIINAGMVNSDTMQKSLDQALFDRYHIPFEAIASTKSFMIIDEPHKFSTIKKTWENIQKMKPQFILRYGATFTSYEKLVYQLTAVDAFNHHLVKGMIAHVTEFEHGNQTVIELIHTDGTEATFKITENGKSKTEKLIKSQSFSIIHSAMQDLEIENLNKSIVLLSNGLTMKIGDKINPYTYSETVQELMIKRAIKNHFELEKKLLTRDSKIKPLTLFFIDQIDSYRKADGKIRKMIEEQIKLNVETLLAEYESQEGSLFNPNQKSFYQMYLEKTYAQISATHAGYFSRDHAEKDENIEKEINEILHDKQALLDLNNPRRFIVSKWTLREGWDNPNVFQICKLRSSGSEISKLQEVGRGLRLPVNEYGNRVKDEIFDLHYFVDFTERDFVKSLISEINLKSGKLDSFKYDQPTQLNDEMIQEICKSYDLEKNTLLEELTQKDIIDRSNQFKANGFEFIKKNYPLIFGVAQGRIRSTERKKDKVKIKTDKFHMIKNLIEIICQKVVLEYQFSDEHAFKNFLKSFLSSQKDQLISSSLHENKSTIRIQNGLAVEHTLDSIKSRNLSNMSTMKYSDFLKELSRVLHINLKTLHESFVELNTQEQLAINRFLNQATIRMLKEKFEHALMTQATKDFQIAYHKMTHQIHPTKFTDAQGNVLSEIPAHEIGVYHESDESVSPNYLLDTPNYDSELEKENIQSNINEVLVFTKLPKNSIKIPIAGGKTYSPDFAYVLKIENQSQNLNLIIETKNVPHSGILREEESAKINQAKLFFGTTFEIRFETQFSNNKITDLIDQIIKSSNIPPDTNPQNA
jgi:type III restriction enzyme